MQTPAVSSRQGYPPPVPLPNPAVADPIKIECTDLQFTVIQKKQKRVILNNLSCVFYGGTLNAILGPSGCGKTTLMMAISGRMSSRYLKLTLSANGSELNAVANRSNVGVVPAHETLFPTDTPREAIRFVAKLTRPELNWEQRRQLAREMIHSLRLTSSQDTYMGSAVIKGVSSGEKKRSSVGLELMPERIILFLDEPTTGLDAVTAFELIELLRKVAHERQVCVVAVIHQPSAKIWELFDNVMFMVRGEIVYHGPVGAVPDYFGSRGYTCPSGFTPADYVMFVLQTVGDSALEDLIQDYRPAILATRQLILDERRLVREGISRRTPLKPFQRSTFASQFTQLVAREYRSTTRDLTVVFLRVCFAFVFATIIGFLFFQVGTQPGGAANASHIGLVAALAIFSISSSGQSLLMSYAAERPIALREYGSGFYTIWAYSLSKDVLEIPLVTLAVLIYLTLGYLIGGLQGSFLLLVCLLSFSILA
jgi:ABC-type multidrug transport system ATPase subunit